MTADAGAKFHIRRKHNASRGRKRARGEVIAREIIEKCSLADSKIAVSFVSPSNRFLLGLIEGNFGRSPTFMKE